MKCTSFSLELITHLNSAIQRRESLILAWQILFRMQTSQHHHFLLVKLPTAHILTIKNNNLHRIILLLRFLNTKWIHIAISLHFYMCNFRQFEFSLLLICFCSDLRPPTHTYTRARSFVIFFFPIGSECTSLFSTAFHLWIIIQSHFIAVHTIAQYLALHGV